MKKHGNIYTLGELRERDYDKIFIDVIYYVNELAISSGNEC